MATRSSGKVRLFSGFGAGMVVMAGSLLGTSCSDQVTGPSDLLGGVWKLQSMEVAGASSPFVPDDPDRFTVAFEAGGRLGVVADCNSCGGSYTLDGEALTVPPMACTLALCATPSGGEFASLIQGNASIDLDGDTLEIVSPGGRLALVR